MKKSLQRFLSVFLALVMVVSMLPTAAFATEEHDHDHEHETVIEGSVPDTSAEGEETPAEGEETPAEGEETPAEGEETPAEGEETPAEGEETPAEGEETPAEGEETPAEGEETPAEGEETPAEGGETPAEGEETPENPEENTGTPEIPEQGSEGAVVAPEGTVEPAPETPVPAPEVVVPTLLDEVKAAIDELLVVYGLEVGMSARELESAALDMDWHLDPEADMEALEDLAYDLTEEELEELQDYEPLQTWVEFCDVYAEVYSIELMTTVTVLDGQVSLTDTRNAIEYSNGTVTATSEGGAGILTSPKTNTITIYNNTENLATLTFDYTASNYSSFSESTASNSYSAVLDPDAFVTISITGKKAVLNNTATLKMSNFKLQAAADQSEVTITFDDTYGSVTAAGSSITKGSSISV